jgi:hypothetical protein
LDCFKDLRILFYALSRMIWPLTGEKTHSLRFRKGGRQIAQGARLRTKRLLRTPYVLQEMRTLWRGFAKWRYGFDWPAYAEPKGLPDAPNPLRAFFDARKEGPGIWKWIQYFDIYDRHFSRFRNREVNVLEVGIYSGAAWKCGEIISDLVAGFTGRCRVGVSSL